MGNAKVALVTGASSGIGRSTVQLLADRGFRVFGTSRTPATVDLDAAIDILPLDVRSTESVHACVEEVVERAGQIDALVNNAGYIVTGAVEEVSVDEAQAQFETNFFGVLRTVSAVLPGMRKRGSGTIVNISSLSGLIPAPPFWSVYSASKHALESYTEHLWREVRPFGLRVALIEPGPIRTGLTSNSRQAKRTIPAYSRWRERALEAARSAEKLAPDPSVVAKVIASVLVGKSTQLRHRVGKEATWIPRLRKLVPHSIFERQLKSTFDIRDMT